MKKRYSPVLVRKHPVTLRRAVVNHFGTAKRLRVSKEEVGYEGYRADVNAILASVHGVTMPPSLCSIAESARRRAIPAEAFAAFVAELFELEPLGG